MILPRTQSSSLDITNDVTGSVIELADEASRQLSGNRVGEANSSREQTPPLSPSGGPPGNVLLRREGRGKRKNQESSKKSKETRKKSRKTAEEQEVESDSLEVIEDQEVQKNSDDFSVDERPELFHDDKKFNRLSYETAAKICWEFKQLKERKAMKVRVNIFVSFIYKNEYPGQEGRKFGESRRQTSHSQGSCW